MVFLTFAVRKKVKCCDLMEVESCQVESSEVETLLFKQNSTLFAIKPAFSVAECCSI